MCVMEYKSSTLTNYNCCLPEPSRCTICLRQHPKFSIPLCTSSLLWSNLDRFQLTPNTTYHHYVYASLSDRVTVLNLLRPEYPIVRITFRFNSAHRKLHLTCPSDASWKGDLHRSYLSMRSFENSWQKRTHIGAVTVIKDYFSKIHAQIPAIKSSNVYPTPSILHNHKYVTLFSFDIQIFLSNLMTTFTTSLGLGNCCSKSHYVLNPFTPSIIKRLAS
jgi:hypothetical protein